MELTETKRRLFIYDRNEMIVLLMIIGMLALFSFTLGLHWGKHLGVVHKFSTGAGDTSLIQTAKEELPTSQELIEEKKVSDQTIEDALSQELHDEVIQSGIRISKSKPIDLPDQTKAGSAGATSLTSIPKVTLLVGSYPSFLAARKRVGDLHSLQVEPFWKKVRIDDQDLYRVYLGAYRSEKEAQETGESLKKRHLIDAFSVQEHPSLQSVDADAETNPDEGDSGLGKDVKVKKMESSEPTSAVKAKDV